jgi:hypothetical protein
MSFAKQEARRQYYDSFRWRSLAVSRYVDELLAEWRSMTSGRIRGGFVAVVDRVGGPPARFDAALNAPAPPRSARRLNDGEDYEDWRTGEPMLDGMTHPGL